MQPFEYFEHTADVGLLARGRTLPEAFANAGRGLMNLIVDLETVQGVEARDVALAGEDLEDLLVAWLNELLFLFDSEGFVPVSFDFSALAEDELHARALGEVFDPRRHHVKTGVKAATYHQVAVERDGEYRLRVILDV